MRAVLLCLLLLSTQAFALCQEPWRLNVGDWQPYMYPLPGADAGGIDVDVVKRLAQRLGCRLQISRVPPERAHPMLQSGDIDILMAASDLPERRRYARFSIGYRNEVMAVFAPAPAKAVSAPAKAAPAKSAPANFDALLRGKARLLAPRFGWYGSGYDKVRAPLAEAGRLEFYDDYAQGIAMLAAGRGDLLLGDDQALLHTAGKQGLRLKQLFVANSSPVHLMFSRTRFSEADMARINAALAPPGKGLPGGNR